MHLTLLGRIPPATMRWIGLLVAVLAGSWLLLIASRPLRRAWQDRVAVEGRSMSPTLEPGDWLLVDATAYHTSRARPGDLVVVPDPRLPTRLLIKRVAERIEPDTITLRGDNPTASTDSRTFGAVSDHTLLGRPWGRYWPLRRIGRIR